MYNTLSAAFNNIIKLCDHKSFLKYTNNIIPQDLRYFVILYEATYDKHNYCYYRSLIIDSFTIKLIFSCLDRTNIILFNKKLSLADVPFQKRKFLKFCTRFCIEKSLDPPLIHTSSPKIVPPACTSIHRELCKML